MYGVAAKQVVSEHTLPSSGLQAVGAPAIQYATSSPTVAVSGVVFGPRCFSIAARSVEPGISVSNAPTPVAATSGIRSPGPHSNVTES